MKDTVLGFKYWVDEPGDTVMYMGSENHRFLFHVAEWMAGQLFPPRSSRNSRMRGLYHATKGRTYITEWLRQRGRFGFDEWHSNSYFPVNIAPLINVYDFAIYEDAKLRRWPARCSTTCSSSWPPTPTRASSARRTAARYGINLKYPDYEGTSSTCWLLYGTGSLIQGQRGHVARLHRHQQLHAAAASWPTSPPTTRRWSTPRCARVSRRAARHTPTSASTARRTT